MIVCDNCGAISDTLEDKEMIYWVEKADLKITRCLCSKCKPLYIDYSFDTFEQAMDIIKLRAKYIGEQ